MLINVRATLMSASAPDERIPTVLRLFHRQQQTMNATVGTDVFIALTVLGALNLNPLRSQNCIDI